MYTVYEDDVVATANWSARGFMIPPLSVDLEVAAVTLFVNDAIAVAGASALLERNFGMSNPFQFSGALTEQKSNSRSAGSGAQDFQDVADTTGMGGNFFGVLGCSPGRDSNVRWRPPRPWARIIIDGTQAAESFCLAMDRFQAAGQIGNCHMSYVIGYRFSYMGNRVMRLVRRPRTPGVWHYQQVQNRRLGQSAMIASTAPEYWVGYAPYSPNIRQEQDGASTLLLGAGGGPNLTLISIDASLVMTPTLAAKALHLRSVDASLVLGAAMNRRLNLSVPASLTLTAALTAQAKRLISIVSSLVLTPVLVRLPVKTQSVTLTLTPTSSLRLTRLKTIAASLTMTPAIARVLNKFMPVGVTLTPAISTRLTRIQTLAASLVMTPTMARKPVKTQAASLVLTAAEALRITRLISLSASLVNSATMNRKLFKPVSATLATNPVMLFAKSKFITVSTVLSLNPAMARKPVKLLNASLAATPVLVRAKLVTVPAALTLTPSIVRQRLFSRTIAAGLILTPAIAQKRIAVQTLAANLSLSPGSTLKRLGLIRFDTPLGLSAALTRRFSMTQAANLPMIVNVDVHKGAKVNLISIGATLNLVADMKNAVGRKLSASLVLIPGVQWLVWRFVESFLSIGFHEARLLAAQMKAALLEGTAEKAPGLLSASESIPEIDSTGMPKPRIRRVL